MISFIWNNIGNDISNIEHYIQKSMQMIENQSMIQHNMFAENK